MKKITLLSVLIIICSCSNKVKHISEFEVAIWFGEAKVLYIFHKWAGYNDGIIRPTSFYTSSSFELVTRNAPSNNFEKREIIFSQENSVPCGELIWDSSANIIAFSYEEFEESKYCSDEHKYIFLSLEDDVITHIDTIAPDSNYYLMLANSKNINPSNGIIIKDQYEKLCLSSGNCVDD